MSIDSPTLLNICELNIGDKFMLPVFRMQTPAIQGPIIFSLTKISDDKMTYHVSQVFGELQYSFPPLICIIMIPEKMEVAQV